MATAVFMGTPTAAIPSLDALAEVCDVETVVTRPDRPRGRSRRPQPPPVKVRAEELGIPVVQPSTRPELTEWFSGLDRPDVGVVVAFGMILEPAVLAHPTHGFLNVHFSLLPRWRGAAPVERAIMAGDQRTGVSLMEMDEGLDTGPIVATMPIAIGPTDTGGALTERLAGAGADLLRTTLPAWLAGGVDAKEQPQSGATHAARIEADDRNVDATMTVRTFVDTVRALAPDQGARLWIDGEAHKVLEAAPVAADVATGSWSCLDDAPVLGVRDGAVVIGTLQPPGKRPMSGEAWLRGRRLPSPGVQPPGG